MAPASPPRFPQLTRPTPVLYPSLPLFLQRLYSSSPVDHPINLVPHKRVTLFDDRAGTALWEIELQLPAIAFAILRIVEPSLAVVLCTICLDRHLILQQLPPLPTTSFCLCSPFTSGHRPQHLSTLFVCVSSFLPSLEPSIRVLATGQITSQPVNWELGCTKDQHGGMSQLIGRILLASTKNKQSINC